MHSKFFNPAFRSTLVVPVSIKCHVSFLWRQRTTLTYRITSISRFQISYSHQSVIILRRKGKCCGCIDDNVTGIFIIMYREEKFVEPIGMTYTNETDLFY